MRKMIRCASIALALALGAHVHAAEPAAQTLLVLDASGSMWGQINGGAKIELAREAVQSMTASWPEQNALGLMVYGHRQKGDCNDIELILPPAPGQGAAIVAKVNAITPKGMTPISAAVRQAAETLKFSEQAATVILVSDGEETCNADPCALGAELEKLGVSFTAHVIGFDVSNNAKAQRELKCLADNTGGRYIEARDAAGLNAALSQVSSEKPQPPAKVVEAPMWIENASLVPDFEQGWLDPNAARGNAHIEMKVGQTAKDCEAMCMSNDACGGWHYEPTGSFFVEFPRCSMKDKTFPLLIEMHNPGEGWVAGVKPGVKLISAPK